MQRIVLWSWLLAMPLAAGAQVTGDMQGAVGVVVLLEGNTVQGLDISFPSVSNMNEIQEDLQAVARWTGWAAVGEPAETRGNATSVHVQITGGEIQSILKDAVWPLVAALAEHQRLGIVVMGAPVATAPLVIENRFVRLEQSGGQGVQSYLVQVKDTDFRSIEQLQKPETSGRTGRQRPAGGHMGLAWLLVIVAAGATGAAVYLIVSWLRNR